jgi:hypothetical protein
MADGIEGTAPDADAQPLDGTAVAAPPANTAPAPVPDKPVANDPNLLRAEFTRVSQKWAAAAKAAGLDPRTATPEQIVAALRPQTPEQGAPMDPVVAQRLADQDARLWDLTRTAYPVVADETQNFVQLIQSGERDAVTLTQAMHAAFLRWQDAQAAGTTSNEPAAAPATPEEPLPVGDADRAPTPPTAPAPGGRRDSGTVSKLRTLLGAPPNPNTR